MHTIDKVKIPQYCSTNKTLKEKAFPIAASEDTSTCYLLFYLCFLRMNIDNIELSIKKTSGIITITAHIQKKNLTDHKVMQVSIKFSTSPQNLCTSKFLGFQNCAKMLPNADCLFLCMVLMKL